jgi:hypothetical protein
MERNLTQQTKEVDYLKVRSSLIIVGVVITLVLAAGSIQAENDPSMDELREELIFDVDEFRGITFIKHQRENKSVSKPGARFLPYIGHDDSLKWMFARAYYRGNGWIFMEQVYVIIDGKRYQTPKYPSGSDLVDHDVFTGGVSETIHFRWQDVEELGRAIANASVNSEIKVRFFGDKYFDFVLTPEDIQAWKEIVYYFDNIQIGD